MFEKSQFYINFLKNFEIFHNRGEISILVKFLKISILMKFSQNLDYSYNSRKMPILEKRFEESRFQSKFLNNFNYSHNVRKISISHQFNFFFLKVSIFCQNFRKKIDFIQNI